jgi:hypothetical protein
MSDKKKEPITADEFKLEMASKKELFKRAVLMNLLFIMRLLTPVTLLLAIVAVLRIGYLIGIKFGLGWFDSACIGMLLLWFIVVRGK